MYTWRQCCGSRTFWYGSGSGSCFSLWYGSGSESCFPTLYGSGSDCLTRIPDPDPYCFKEVMYLTVQTVLFIHLYFIFLVSRSNRTHTEGILCSILPSSKFFWAHESSLWIRIRILGTRGTDPDPGKCYGSRSGSATLPEGGGGIWICCTITTVIGVVVANFTCLVVRLFIFS